MPFDSRFARFAWFVAIAALLIPTSAECAKKSNAEKAPDAPAGKKQTPSKTKTEKPKSEPLVYVAKQGETLGDIAEMFGTTVEAILAANSFPPEIQAEPGLVISVPVGKKKWVDPDPNERLGSYQGETFAREALSYRGVPYRRAGTTSRGLDCSGLVYRVLRSHGLDIPRTSAALFGVGIPVSKHDLSPGDLVFFNTVRGRRVSHVGIYIGEGEFVHASSSRGRVTVSPLNTGYYARHYVGARRLVTH